MANPRSMHFSDKFAISCGTVTLDLQARKVLIILWRKNGEYMIPKGRKDIGEGLETTAVRETFEETGFQCQLLPHSFPTLATTDPVEKTGDVGQSTEPFAVTQRTTDGKLKIIFWYLAQADSTAPKIHDTQMEDEDFDTVWVEEAKVLEKLTYDEDRAITSKAMEYWKGL
ncbi:uncharacterized protein EAE98_008475 [Botrytis deweyae]|uniref:Nudix hydrolase domain-containing protein n=2 Tax=Botrytis TaxID=33196 RepID=A0A4Z1JGZ6_9HELO|nr:uncharacterized protein EAE98_008475 [Botrytis deweyae]KAF7908796.1 hypothetical protein EAE99_011666 [Botrytis elliptica]KAF7921628.1 hypothetical protein EAE98_008475 [Botrytis deweyae]TGO70820.1 hypothetical protein BELL_0661g00070 [Botrytis elliptica]